MKLFLKMRSFIFLFLFFMSAQSADAFVPVMIEQESARDITVIEDPGRAVALYGEMQGFPHTFEIRATEPFFLSMQIRLPDIESTKNNVSGIIIKERPGGGRVIEIARLLTKDATWETTYDFWGGDTYRLGPSFAQELEAGTYRIEVQTPDNVEKYVLMLGTERDFSVGYIDRFGGLFAVKEFFEKSPIRVFESAYVYTPLLLIGACLYFFKRRRTQKM